MSRIGIGAMVVLFTLAGCAGASTDARTATVESSQSSPSAEATAQEASTASAAEVSFQQSQQFTIEYYGLTEDMVPEVEVVRWIAPEERDQVRSECMSDLGFPESPDGGWNYIEEQAQALGVAMYTCDAMYRIDEIYEQPYGDAEHQRYYDYWRDTVLPCLTDKGYATNELPSFEVFTATAGTTDEYGPVGESWPSVAYDEAMEACKVIPSTDYVLGLSDTP